MRTPATYLVTVTPARENAGEYQVSAEVSRIPDDVSFLTLYACTELERALGYFDEVVRKLGTNLWDEMDWLDDFNECLSIGDLAQICLYQLFSANYALVRIANTVIMIGGDVQK